MITVGKAAKMFGLSRTALLYYDDIGLLKPSMRTEKGYRVYSDGDIERLRQIISLRDAGVPLSEISGCLDSQNNDIPSILLKRLNDINTEIEKSRIQQAVIIKLIKDTDIKQKRIFKREEWLETLHRAGVEQDNALGWHFQFEKQSPEEHKNLLLALGFGDEEIAAFKKIYTDNRVDL